MTPEQPKQFCPLDASLPKHPGRYLCKIKVDGQVVVKEVDYERLSDGNMDFDLTDWPEGAEVIAFKHLKQSPVTNETGGKGEQEIPKEESEFIPCDHCDGHDACHDFGCAILLGLGHMVSKEPGTDGLG